MTCSPSQYTLMNVRYKWFVYWLRLYETAWIIYFQITLDSALFRPELRVDPLSRCAALMLPQASAAILPFYQTQAELEIMEQDQSQLRFAVPFRCSLSLTLFLGMYPILQVSFWTLGQKSTA